MSPTLAFRLKVAGKDEVTVLGATSISYRCHGLLELDGDYLRIQWGGVRHVEEVLLVTVRDEDEPLPDDWLDLPVSALRRVTLAGGWLSPHLLIEARETGLFGDLPGATAVAARFWYARSDRFEAIAMQRALTAAIEAASGYDREE